MPAVKQNDSIGKGNDDVPQVTSKTSDQRWRILIEQDGDDWLLVKLVPLDTAATDAVSLADQIWDISTQYGRFNILLEMEE